MSMIRRTIMGNKKKESIGEDEESSDFRNPNAEDYVLQPGEKRVRFSICEATFAPQVNFAYEEDDEAEDMEAADPSPSTFQQVRSRRRDSAYPVDLNGEDDKRIFIDSEGSDETSTNNQSSIAQDLKTLGDDPYEVTDFEEEPSTPWAELETKEKVWKVLVGIGKVVGLLGLLYFFVCSLDLLSKGFRLIGGRTAGEIFQQSDILQNPVVGVMIGILTTVLVQSSSTSTSIIVGMVAAGFMDVKLAIPLIMGSNIGTSITNTIVSFMQAGDREQFRRAFAGATILDMFNWITVIVLLIVEVITGYLYHVSKAVVEVLVPDSENGGEVKLLSVLTEPFVNLIVQLDESVLDCWSNPNCTDKVDASLIKENCSISGTSIEVTEKGYDARGVLVYSPHTIVFLQENVQKCDKEFLFAGTSMSDALVGVIVTLGSLIVLCSCLIFVVKLLSSVLKGHVSVIIKKTLNADIPYVPWITGYLAIIVGAVMTFIVQSSSVFTSALTPLVGLGVISLKRVYPLTLGANIGTTTTAILASLATTGNSFQPSMQIALCHFFFNLTGILLFYPIPFMRFPIHMAKFLGDTTAEYRWFAVVYMVLMFAVFPAVFIGLSFAGSIYVIILVSIIGLILAAIIIINVMRSRYPKFLPPFMRTWDWIPLPLRSLKPYDDIFSRLPCCAKCRPASDDPEEEEKSPSAGPAINNDSHQSTVDDGNNFVYYSGGSTIPPPPEEDNHHHQNQNGNSHLFNGTTNYSDSSKANNNTAKSNGSYNPNHHETPQVNNGGIGSSLGSHNNEAFDKGSSESVIV